MSQSVEHQALVFVRHAVEANQLSSYAAQLRYVLSGATAPVRVAGLEVAGARLNVILSVTLPFACPEVAGGARGTDEDAFALELLHDLLSMGSFAPLLAGEPTEEMRRAAAPVQHLIQNAAPVEVARLPRVPRPAQAAHREPVALIA